MSKWTLGWILWIALFFALEIPAIYNKEPDDTLSEHFRKMFRTHGVWGRFIWFAVFGFFAAWFAWHIAASATSAA